MSIWKNYIIWPSSFISLHAPVDCGRVQCSVAGVIYFPLDDDALPPRQPDLSQKFGVVEIRHAIFVDHVYSYYKMDVNVLYFEKFLQKLED